MSKTARAIRDFTDAILHGDETHRAWLHAAAEAFIAGQPMPAPTGQGTSESLRADNNRLREALELYRHCRHGQIDCFCTKEARAAPAKAAGS